MDRFIEPFHGWIIRVGPNARQRPDPYLYAFPLSSTGEFVGVSTAPLTTEAVRTAIDAARSLGFSDPHWLHKRKDKPMSKYIARLPLASTATPNEPFSEFMWHLEDDTDLVDFQEAIALALIALGRKRAAAAPKAAS